jgi:hypothetical protein
MSPEDVSQARQQLTRLRTERDRLEQEFLARHRLLKGSLLHRSKVCLKPGCKCTRGEPHPPLTYLSWSEGGKSRQLYVPPGDRERVQREVQAYQRLRQARARWVKLQSDILALLDALEAGQRETYPFGAGQR